jgi:hypothetical protein
MLEFLKIIFFSFGFTSSLFFPQISLIIAFFIIEFLLQATQYQKFFFLLFHGFFFYFPLVLWLVCYVIKENLLIFYYFFFFLCTLSFISWIILFLTTKIKFFFKNIIFITIIENTLLFSSLYYALGNLYTPGCIAPNFYPLTGIAWFGTEGLPFFHQKYYWLYFMLFQLLVHVALKYRIFYLILLTYAFCTSITYKKNINYYWLKEKNQDIEKYLYGDAFIFPENMFFLENENTINTLKLIVEKTKKKLIAGVSWETIEDGETIPKHGVIYITKDEKIYLREKKHYLRFSETKNSSYSINSNEPLFPEEIFICSELFLKPPQNAFKNKIFIASLMWTKTPFTWWYKNFMITLYDLHQMP